MFLMSGGTMKEFRLQDQFKSVTAERGLICTISKNPVLFWEVEKIIADGAICEEQDAWRALALAISTGGEVPQFPDWLTTDNPNAAVLELNELFRKRAISEGLQRAAARLSDPANGVAAAVDELEAAVAQARRAAEDYESASVVTAAAILPKVMQQAEEQERARKETGKVAIGLRTGITHLDELLDGLTPGLEILAGGPGVGKTSFALHIASAISKQVPVIFVTFENSPDNLLLKAICAHAEIPIHNVGHGTADLQKLSTAALNWMQDGGQRLAFISGNSVLTAINLCGRMRQVMERWSVHKCFVVVDFLQVWAKCAREYRRLDSSRARVEALGADLRDVAVKINSPVLAISSQNREHGGYGEGSGKASLESLKESGDLEYLADVAMFLVNSKSVQPTPPLRPLELVIRKNRYGDIGTVRLSFRPDISRFREEKYGAKY
jgi:replicative DNA helicase